MRKLELWAARAKNGLRERVVGKIFTKFPGKTTLNIKVVGKYGLPCFISIAIVYSLFSSPDDTSHLSRSDESVGKQLSKTTQAPLSQEAVKGLSKESPNADSHVRKRTANIERQANINFRAKQVIERTESSDPHNTLPTGSQFIGRLATAIDTRDIGGIVKVELPYGSSLYGNEVLPKGSLLFATTKFDGNGEKVFLDIQTGVCPDGVEFKIRAQALSARDFSPGVEGDYHGTFSNRVASQLGLTFISGLTETLVEKESANNGSVFAPSSTTPKPTLKNGLLTGASKVTDQEAQRIAQELSSKPPFVTVEAGKELIISLLEKFVKPK